MYCVPYTYLSFYTNHQGVRSTLHSLSYFGDNDVVKARFIYNFIQSLCYSPILNVWYFSFFFFNYMSWSRTLVYFNFCNDNDRFLTLMKNQIFKTAHRSSGKLFQAMTIFETFCGVINKHPFANLHGQKYLYLMMYCFSP